MARFRPALARLIFVLSILGPGFITANVDNDSGGIYTYAAAGAQYGYALLWTIIPVTICLRFAQEISARMGVATGKGLSELIREEYGLRIAFLLMTGLVLCNIGDVVSEFAGVASSLDLFGVPKYATSEAKDKRIVDLKLPRGVLILLLVRDGREMIPNGGTTLREGDLVQVFADPEFIRGEREVFVGSRHT